MLERAFIDDTSRKSTYPNALWEYELDGLVLTAHLFKNNTFSPTVRAIYGELAYLSSDKGQYVSAENQKSSIYLLQMETSLNFGNTEGFLIFDSMQLSNYFPDWDISRYERSGDIVSLGTADINLIHLQFNDIANSGLDFYTSYASTSFQSNGNRIQYELTDTSTSNKPSTFCAGIGQSYDCSHETAEIELSGKSVNMGIRYQIPIDTLSNPKIGIEYHEATDNYFKPDYYSEYNNYELVFQNVIGRSGHLYWIQSLDKSTFLRLGMYSTETSDSLKSFPGIASTQDFQDIYLLINTRF